MSDLLTLATLVSIGKVLLAFIPLALIPILITVERRGASLIQDRLGPNRAAIPGVGLRLFGLVHNASDGIKLFTKELVVPGHAHKFWYLVAPLIPLGIALITPALIPFFGPLLFESAQGIVKVSGQILDADSGVLLLFALSGLSVYGVVLGSWASNSKYSLLGGMRASAMMISYEVAMGLSVTGMFLLVGSFSLTDIVEWQGGNVFHWGIVVQPVGFVLFLTSLFAETGRAPFDVAEGESELVAGYFTEYSAMRFGFYYMGEYAHIVIASLLVSTIFLGGYQMPFMDTEAVRANLGYVAGGVLALFALGATWLTFAVNRYRRFYAKLTASDQAERQREYGIYTVAFGSLAVLLGLAAIASAALIKTGTPSVVAEGMLWPAWVNFATAGVQLGVLMAKAMLIVWVFVVVRWTLPRFRYDQIMSLGWKIMLNLALANLLITAIVVTLLGG